ncbi:MAG: site-2 protease family protein [Acidimicrobiia bacterium]|nr:site-2 protease family protein [Acidimicrobiia bacterium]
MRPFRIVRILGVDVVGDASLVALGLLLSWVIYLELSLPDIAVSGTTAFLGALVGGVIFLATVLAHEVSHTAVAQQRGLEVRRIRLMIFGGASELQEEAASPATEAAVAIVGPLTSALIGAGLVALAGQLGGVAEGVLRFVGLANLALAVFNILPGMPLDGGRVLRALLWQLTGDRDKATRLALQSGRLFGLGLIGVGAYLALRSNTGAIGIWVAFVGWFMTRMAASSARSHRLELATRNKTVGDVMRSVTEAVAGSGTVAEAVDLHQIGPRLRTLVVEVGGRVVGLLGHSEVEAIPEEQRVATQVGAAMTRIGPADVLDIETGLSEALQSEAGATRHIVVTEQGRVVGIIGGPEIALLFDRDEADPD